MRSLLTSLLLTSSHARLRYWSAIALYLLILILGSIPGARAEIGNVASGLVLHSCAYAGLTFLLFTGGSGTLPQRAAKAVLTIMLMGALDEYVQATSLTAMPRCRIGWSIATPPYSAQS